MLIKKPLCLFAGVCFSLLGIASCSNQGKVHKASELLPALLTVSDMPPELDSTPVEWYENMRKVIQSPTSPWENTLDPYLCPEAGIPSALTKEQAQLELTGGSIMEILVSSKDAKTLYSELDDAYKKCATDTEPAYSKVTGFKSVGDESSTYKSDLGVVTIARFDNDVMILKWWIGQYYDRVSADYPGIVTKAANKVTAL